ncbi:choice-of-anchor J domain-containing protein [Flavobacterium sp.]|uniref:choice-of-anchor J domain-containing protein n=1 Tax=Flavobacterium sp. TaxID=239 RepID=UPI00261E9133|nr:choice-of-anchor J domain-containing protein [Flavobacterium sp.]
MQKEKTISSWMVISEFFFNTKKSFEMSLFMIFTFVLFSNAASAQLTLENFNSGIPATWAITSNQAVTTNWVPSTVSEGYSGTAGAKVNPSLNNTVGTTAEYYLISPQFVTPGTTEIRFFTKQGSFTNKGTVYQLRLSTANQPDISSFNVVLQSWTEAQLNVSATTYEEKIVTIPSASISAGIPVYIAFVAVTEQTGTSATAGDTWFVDNIRVIDSCAKVTGINSTMSANGGLINWTHATANNFEIQIVPENGGITATGTATGTSFNATTLTSGAPFQDGTTYDVYIKTICDATTGSLWAGPFKIKTSRLGLTCATPTVIPTNISTSPYVLSTNLNTFYDNQTYVPLTSIGLGCQPVGSTQNWLNGEHAFLAYTPPATGLVNVSLATSNNPSLNCYNNLASVFIFDSCTGIGTTANCLGSLVSGEPSGTNSVQLQNLYLQGGQTYYFIISSPFQHSSTAAGSPGLCFTFTLSQPSCPIPSGMSFDNLLQTSARFSWANPQNLASAWQYIAKPVSQGAPNGSDILTPTSTNSNNVASGLAPNTNYNLYVRSVCGGTPGQWSNPFPFTTQCTVFPTPYSTQFTSATAATPEPCWTSIDLNNDGRFFTYGGDPGIASPPQGQILKLTTGAAGNLTNDMVSSPQIHLDGITQKRLRYKVNIYGNWGPSSNPTPGPGSFEIKLSTTGVGPQNFTTTIVPLTSYTTGYRYIEQIVPLPNIVGDVNIAWIVPSGATQTGSWIYIDDVNIDDLPACSPPSYPAITNGSITQNEAQFYWTSGYQNTQWEVAVQPLGSGIPTGSGELVGTNPFTKTGLMASTRYEYYVRAYCSSTLQSEWVGPVAFNTLCDALPVPYYESLNDTDVNTKKFCWSVDNRNGDNNARWTINATNASISPRDLFMNPFVSFDDYLVSANVNVTGRKMLKFNYKVVTDPFNSVPRGNFEVLMSSTPDFSNPTVLIAAHDFDNADFLEDFVIFNGTGPAYFAIHLPSTMDNPRNTGIVVIDDFSIEDAPLCPNPSLPIASNVLTNSATLSWTLGFNETQWEVAIQSPNSGVPTGSGTVVNTNPTYNATGLQANTFYEYYVRAVCGSNYSAWIGPIKFKTICNVLPTPFIETFEPNSPTESCWTVVNNNVDGNQWVLNMTVDPMFGEQMAAMNSYTNGNNDDWLISPTIAAQPNQRLRFYYKGYAFEEDLKVKISSNGVDISQFATILYENNVLTSTTTGTTTGSNTITVVNAQGARVGDRVWIPGWPLPYPTYVAGISGNTITLSNAATLTLAGPLSVEFIHEVINNTEPKEMVINLTGITVPTNINIAFQVPKYPSNSWNYRGSYLYIDNVSVENIPACPSVINVTTNTNNLTDTTATIDWQTTGSETSWEISVQPFGTAAPVGNTLPQYLRTANAHPYTIRNTLPQYLRTANAHPYTITGLTPSTRYQYYVRAVCSGSSQSTWVGPFELLTKCDLSNICEYTITLNNGTTGQVYQGIEVIQNGVVQQTLTFAPSIPNQPPGTRDYQVFLCSGIEFNLFWRGSGSGLQYSQAQIIVKDQSGTVVWTSPLGLGTINTNIYTGVSNCSTVTCAQPTNLAVNNMGVLSWTPGGSETQWEVFVQPLEHGAIPQSGVIVNTPNYTPVASDFYYPTAGTNEFFVRAVCGATNKSYWSGPKVFIRNDEPQTAIRLSVNTNGDCASRGIKGSFIGATASAEATSCSGTNQGDIWYEFVATSKVHTVEISNITGNYYASTYGPGFPTFILSLYEVQPNGSLVEKTCSENNSLVLSYTTELTVGTVYKIRVKNSSPAPTIEKFDICVSTPADICNMNAFNYSFEKLPMQTLTSVTTIIHSKVVPGWRTNTEWGAMFIHDDSDQLAYEGGQYIQLVHDPANTWNPADPNIKGLYKDVATPDEMKKVKYSFASATRQVGSGTTLELWAGPPSGPFTMITEHTTTTSNWSLRTGNYDVPVGQIITRFIFRVRGNAIGHLLDAADFKPNTDIITANATLQCNQNTINVQATGTGQWIADDSNPAVTNIGTPNNETTAISGFNVSGIYNYHWKTRYCDKTITITYQGVDEVATVTTPVTYCTSEVAVPLTATVPSGYTLMWYTQEVGGTGSPTAPTPDTSIVGPSTYYVSAVDANGCTGPRTSIEVIVNETITPIVGFTYDNSLYCKNDPNPVITIDPNFTTGGSFTAQPDGLSIDPTTGEINLLASSGGVYTITYEIAQNGCSNYGMNAVPLTVDGSCVDIPRGISPNNDGSNDSFDLTGLDVNKVLIFNRYGTEVYSFGGNYTNQWMGQSNSGEKLPDGTYFYTVHKGDGTTVTGWVYINK